MTGIYLLVGGEFDGQRRTIDKNVQYIILHAHQPIPIYSKITDSKITDTMPMPKQQVYTRRTIHFLDKSCLNFFALDELSDFEANKMILDGYPGPTARVWPVRR
jgi:hypothetical protein